MMSDNRPAASPWILRPRDQQTIAALVLIGLVALTAWSLSAGKRIELDRQPVRPANFKIDLNAAPWPELSQLPGIGETLARRIVESRQLQGPFTTHEDLLRVSGIGPKTLARVKPYLLPIARSAKAT